MTPGALLSPVLPDTASVNAAGHLMVGGCSTLDLAARFGTPLIVYDEEHLRSRCRQARAAFGGVSYATKAFTCRAMAALAYSEGLTLDVASAGEFMTARAAGVPGSRLVVHGNNKSAAELKLALSHGAHRIAVDSADEFERISTLVKTGYPPAQVWLRVNPGIDPGTHPSIATGQKTSKFGVLAGSSATDQLIERILTSKCICLRGIHIHLGSQIRDLRVYESAVHMVLPYLRTWGLPELCVGGGLAVAYTPRETTPTVTSFAEVIKHALQEMTSAVRVSCELGRWIAATSGITLYTVGNLKHTPGSTPIAAVDGGMIDNLRVALYGANYEMLAADRPERKERPITVVGKHCESGDILAREVLLPNDLRPGDILCSLVTGAYGYSMASSYNRLGRPAVIFVANGRATVVLRRETAADMMLLDAWPLVRQQPFAT